MQIVLGENYINNETGSEFYGLSENMPEDDIKAIVKSFAKAAKRLKSQVLMEFKFMEPMDIFK